MEIKRFDNLEFKVLDASNGGMYSLREDYAERALSLMAEGIIKDNPQQKWGDSGWKLTEQGRQYYRAFLEQMRAKHGHVWMLRKESNPESYEDGDEYGNGVDIFAYSVGYHNGMVCNKCGFSFCVHCDSEMELDACAK